MEQDLLEQTNPIDWGAVMTCLRPGSSWHSTGGVGYEDIIWTDEEQTKPTLRECEECWATLEKSEPRKKVVLDRQDAYRELSDPVFFQMHRGEASEQDWLDSVASVREMYPYPED